MTDRPHVQVQSHDVGALPGSWQHVLVRDLDPKGRRLDWYHGVTKVV